MRGGQWRWAMMTALGQGGMQGGGHRERGVGGVDLCAAEMMTG